MYIQKGYLFERMHQKKANAETLCKIWFVSFVPWLPSRMSNHDGKWVFYDYHIYIYIWHLTFDIWYLTFYQVMARTNTQRERKLGKFNSIWKLSFVRRTLLINLKSFPTTWSKIKKKQEWVINKYKTSNVNAKEFAWILRKKN